jgi:hypothetical protein
MPSSADTSKAERIKRARAFDTVHYGSRRTHVEILSPPMRALHDLVRERWIELDEAHARVLYDWARDEAVRINRLLRDRAGDVDMSLARYRPLGHGVDDDMRLWSALALDAFMVELPEPMSVHRGIDYHEDIAAGEWISHVFTSATWNVEVARRFARGNKGTKQEQPRERPTLLHLELPAGTPVCPIGLTPHGFRREGELVIARGMRFEVTSERELRGLTHVHATCTPVAAT